MKQRRDYQTLLLVLLLFALAAIGWFLYARWQDQLAQTARQQEAAALQQQAQKLSQQVQTLESELKRVQGDNAPADTSGVFGPDAALEAKSADIERIERQVKEFFTYLDSREYVKAYQFKDGSYAQYCAGMAALVAKPPQIAGETESIGTTLNNVTYVYRVMGAKRTELAAEVLKNEAPFLEHAMRLFYSWYTTPAGSLAGKPSTQAMYDYACFLLNTLGGRSYLLRRDSKIRLLTTYYCLLVIDGANERGYNPHGIDIRPYLAATARDMRSQQGLMYRQQYSEALDALIAKYAM